MIIEDDKTSEFDRIDMGTRIRDLQQAANGSIYLLTNEGNGKLVRIIK